MRKIFKKYLTLLIFLSLVFFSANVFGENLAKVSSQTMKLDGENVSMAAYNINGNNYFKLRDLAAILDSKACAFNVSFDEGSASVLIKRNESYKKSEADLKNLENNKTYIESGQKILLDGEKINSKAYLIGGNNFFKLRDLGKAIGFYVGYDQGENSIIIDTSKAYAQETAGKEEKTAKEEEASGNLANQASENGKISFENKKAAGLSLKVLTIPNAANIKFSVVKANDGLIGNESFSSMINRYNPKAAINGNFFDAYKTLVPYSSIVRNGEALQIIGSDPGFYFTKDGMRGVVSSVNSSIKFSSNAGEFSAWYKNRTPANDSSGIYVFDSLFANSVNVNGGSYALISKDDIVLEAKNANGAINIPKEGYIIYFGKDSGAVNYINSLAAPNTRLSKKLVFQDPELAGKEVAQLVAAGPLLVKDGKIAVEESLKNYSESKIHTQKTPRTAIGVKKDGTVIMVTTNANVRSLSNAMLELGCDAATNLDGGASSAMYFNGKTYTSPGRKLNTVLMVFE